MMRAERVWHVWRRILREPPLQEALLTGRLASFGLSPEEQEIALAYAGTPAGTTFFIANFRYRMKSSFINALETTAPLTHRLLRASGSDLDALAVRFLDSVQWHDFGPYVYTYGGQLLDFLLRQPDLAEVHGLAELGSVERAGARLTVAAAGDIATPVASTDTYRTAGPVSPVHCGLDLSPWLRDSRRIGREPVSPRPTWYLVYLRQPDLRRRIVACPAALAELVTALRVPRSAKELSAWHPDPAAAVAPLVKLGIVTAPAR